MARTRPRYTAYSGNVTLEFPEQRWRDKVVWEKDRTYSEQAISSKLRQAYDLGRRELREEIEEALKRSTS